MLIKLFPEEISKKKNQDNSFTSITAQTCKHLSWNFGGNFPHLKEKVNVQPLLAIADTFDGILTLFLPKCYMFLTECWHYSLQLDVTVAIWQEGGGDQLFVLPLILMTTTSCKKLSSRSIQCQRTEQNAAYAHNESNKISTFKPQITM